MRSVATALCELAAPGCAPRELLLTRLALPDLTTYYIGGIVASWTSFGCVYLTRSWSLRLLTLMQVLGLIISKIGRFSAIPGSPRWLLAHGLEEEGRALLERLHANGA